MILLKTLTQIDNIRKSCQIVAYILKELKILIKPGISTAELNKTAEELCFELNAIPAFKGYRGFPYSICASKNEQIVGKNELLMSSDFRLALIKRETNSLSLNPKI